MKRRIVAILAIIFFQSSIVWAAGTVATHTTGSASGGVTGAPNPSFSGTVSASITTSVANTILVTYVSWEGAAAGGTSKPLSSLTNSGSSTLTWTKRSSYYNSANQSQEVWWAFAPNAGTYSVNASWSSTNVDDYAINIVSFTGVDTNSPWDSSTASFLAPGAISGTISTSNASTYLLAFFGNCNYNSPATPIPNGLVSVIGTSITNAASWWQYSYILGGSFSSIQTNLNLGWTSYTAGNVGVCTTGPYLILDALKGSGQNTPITISSIATARKNQSTNIVFNMPGSSGTLSAYANGRAIPRCFNISVGAISSYTCSWKPAITGINNIYATFTATGSQTVTSTTPISTVQVANRSSGR